MDKQQKEIDLSKIVGVLKNNRKQIGISTGVTTFIAIMYCIFTHPIFTAKTIINPPKLTDAGTGIAQALNGLAALTGGGGFLNQKTDADVTIAILQTTSLKNMIIHKFNLQEYLKKEDIELTRKTLNDKIKFIPDTKSGFVEIDVDDEDPKLASAIANYYTIALGQMISNISYSRSNIKFQFFNEQLSSAESALNVAEDNLKYFVESNGFIAGQQAEVAAGLSTQLQAQIIVAQAQLQSMRMYAAPDNPDYIQLESQIVGYKQQLDNLNVPGTPDPVGIPANIAPAMAKQYANLMRELILRKEIYSVIAKQYEANRLDALSEMIPVGIQVVDPAVIPLHKSRPKRLLITVGGLLMGLFGSSIYFIIRNRKKIIIDKLEY